MSLAMHTAARLQRAAADTGFDRPMCPVGEWLVYESSHAPLRIWLTAAAPTDLLVAFSRSDVERALEALGAPSSAAPPSGTSAVRSAPSYQGLCELLRRAHQLARTLPRALIGAFEHAVDGLPSSTDGERLVIRRIGEDVFRDGLMDYWDGRCAITGLDVRELLRARHVKPWDRCETDAVRFDVFNGLLLALHLDAAFEAGLIGVTDSGAVVASSRLTEANRGAIGWDPAWSVRSLEPEHLPYLRWHLDSVFIP